MWLRSPMFDSWWKRVFKPVKREKSQFGKRRRSARPIPERLEDRILLATRTWTGGDSTNDLWSDADNWDSGIPADGDDVIIPAMPGSAEVLFDSSVAGTGVTLNSLRCDEPFRMSGDRLTVQGIGPFVMTAGLTFSGGTLDGTGTLSVGGMVTWTGGTMSGSGQTEAGGGMTISGTATKILNQRALNNTGTAIWTGTGTIRGGDGGTINNSGLFDIQTDADFVASGGSTTNEATFRNSGGGTLRKSVAGGASDFTGGVWTVNNDGVIDVQSGTLNLNHGSTSSGSFSAANLATLNFGTGTHTLAASSSVSGAGTIGFTGGTTHLAGTYNVAGRTIINSPSGTANFNAAATTRSLELSSGMLSGTGTLTVTGPTTWTAGIMSGSGVTNAYGGMQISSVGAKLINQRTLNIAGTATWTAGNFSGGNGSTINNSGLFDIQTDTDFLATVGGAAAFHNSGTFRKSAGSASTDFQTPWTFRNTGSVEALSGNIGFFAYAQTGGSLRLGGGSVSSSQSMQIQGGAVAGNGTVMATINNSGGAIVPGTSPGSIHIAGDYVQTGGTAAGGELIIEIGGPEPVTGFDQVIVSGFNHQASLAGTLTVKLIDDFVPEIGDSFAILEGPATGEFDTLNLPSLPAGRSWQAGVGSIVLSVVAVNIPPTVTLANENPLTVDEGSTHRYEFSISDLNGDKITAVTASCGAHGRLVAGSSSFTNISGSFQCTFADGPATSTVSAGATDSHNAAGATDSQVVAVNDIEGGPADSQATALRRLQEESIVPPRIRFENGIPHFVSAEVPLANCQPEDDPVRQALIFLEDFRDLYRLTDPRDQLFLDRITRNDRGWHVFFGQRQASVPVFGAQLAVHLDQCMILATNGNYLPNVAAIAPAVLSARDAEAIAQADEAVGSPEIIGRSSLIVSNAGLVSDQPGETHLAWRVTMRGHSRSNGISSAWMYLIDAHNGKVLSVLDNSRSDAADKDFDVQTGNNDTSDSCWLLTSSDDQWFNEDGPTDDYPGGVANFPGGDFDGDAAFNFTHENYDYYFNTFHRHSYDAEEEDVEVYVHVGTGFQNARYRPDCDIFEFGDGFVVLDVFAHEFAHGVTDSTSGLVYENQSGALNESYSDVFGEFVEDTFQGPADWLNGTALAIGASRSLQNPPAFNDPDHMLASLSGDGRGLRTLAPGVSANCNANDCGFVHINSGIPNKAAYLIAQGDTHNGLTIAGIGREKAQQLYYEVLTTRLTSGSQFNDARDQTVYLAQVYAANAAYEFTPADVCSVVNAFASVGLGLSDRDCDGTLDDVDTDDDQDFITDSSDNCAIIANPGQENSDSDALGDICDTDDDGDGILEDGDGSGIEGDNPCAGGDTIDCDDNAPRRSNEDQADDDSDGIGDVIDDDDGDGVSNPRDNCRYARNRDQVDTDGDGPGDACDFDDDNDGVLDSSDNAPLVPNADQVDSDTDGAGDVIDNCVGTANSDQTDIDGDATGDACDSDDDGDAVPDTVDNCPSAFNPSQDDFDGNGAGLECDLGEQFLVLGTPLHRWLQGTFKFRDIRPKQIRIEPCREDCPDWIAEEFLTTVELHLPFDLPVRIVDDRGTVLRKSNSRRAAVESGLGVVKVLRFHPDQDFYYRAPHTEPRDGSERSYARAAGGPDDKTEPYQGRQYFVEIIPDERVELGREYPFRMSIGSRAAGDAVNDPPTFDAIAHQTVNEDSGAAKVTLTGVLAGPFDEFMQTVTISAISSDPAIVPHPTYDPRDQALRFAPASDMSGEVTISVTADDGQATDNTFVRTFQIIVSPVNDAPVFDAIPDQVIQQNSLPRTISITGVSPGPANETSQAVKVTAKSSDPEIVAMVAISGSGATRTLEFQPESGAIGDVTITITADDGQSSNPSFIRDFVISVVAATIGSIRGQKFDDRNGNGVHESSEPGLDGWSIDLIDAATGTVVATQVTHSLDSNGDGAIDAATERGRYSFLAIDPGSYVVREQAQPGWHQTFPAGRVERVSTGGSGVEANAASYQPSISADGRFVTFVSAASNLVAGDTNGRADVFVVDRQAGSIERISVSESGEEANGSSFEPSISANGQVVAFRSHASNLVPGDTNEVDDIFVFDRAATPYTMRRASVAANRLDADGPSSHPVLSANGRFVAFESEATNLVPGDTNHHRDIFRYDRLAGSIDLVTQPQLTPAGGPSFAPANGPSFAPAISATGRLITFESFASNLAPGDTNQMSDIFLFDRGVIQLVTVNGSGMLANGPSSSPSISSSLGDEANDGRFIAFESGADNLIAGDLNNHRDVFVYDREASAVVDVVSVANNGALGEQDSLAPSISGDGQLVVFQSASTNFAPHGRVDDIFLFNRQNRSIELLSRHPMLFGTPSIPSTRPAISADGQFTTFESLSPWLASDDNDAVDVFVHARDKSYSVTVAAGQELGDFDFGNHSVASTIAGAVFEDFDGDRVRDLNEPGIDGRTIELRYASNDLVLMTHTTRSVDLDEDGRIDPMTEQGLYSFEFEAVRPGEFSVQEMLPAGISGSPSRWIVEIGRGQRVGAVNFADFRLGEIRGTAFLDLNRNGVQTAGELGFNDRTIYLDANGNDALDTGEAQVQTDANGDYTFMGLAAGTYTVRQVAIAGLTRTTPAGGEHVASLLSSGSVVDGLDFGEFGRIVQFAGSTFTVNEGAGRSPTATIRVNLFPAADSTVTVAYSTSDGTATASRRRSRGDYASASGTLRFRPGQTEQSFTVRINNDSTDEIDESIRLLLRTPANALLGPQDLATLIIVDDDPTAVRAGVGNSKSGTQPIIMGDRGPAAAVRAALASRESIDGVLEAHHQTSANTLTRWTSSNTRIRNGDGTKRSRWNDSDLPGQYTAVVDDSTGDELLTTEFDGLLLLSLDVMDFQAASNASSRASTGSGKRGGAVTGFVPPRLVMNRP